MKIYRVKRYGECLGQPDVWLVDNVFSTKAKATQWMDEHPVSYVYQEVVEQELD